MWQAIVEIIKAAMESGMVGIVVIVLIAWMADRYMLVRDLKEQNAMMISAFKDNTKAVTELATLINQLCQRV